MGDEGRKGQREVDVEADECGEKSSCLRWREGESVAMQIKR